MKGNGTCFSLMPSTGLDDALAIFGGFSEEPSLEVVEKLGFLDVVQSAMLVTAIDKETFRSDEYHAEVATRRSGPRDKSGVPGTGWGRLWPGALLIPASSERCGI